VIADRIQEELFLYSNSKMSGIQKPGKADVYEVSDLLHGASFQQYRAGNKAAGIRKNIFCCKTWLRAMDYAPSLCSQLVAHSFSAGSGTLLFYAPAYNETASLGA
jgi:hypothetical protein